MMLLDALVAAAKGRQRLDRTTIWRAFQAAHPVESAAGDARERLRVRLDGLAAEGLVALPAQNGKAWDRSARPALPEFLLLPRRDAANARTDPRTVPWAPELAFLASLPHVEHLDAALAIQDFLARGGRLRPLVPMRERSVQLFGDEKRLERLLRTPLFGEGRLEPKTLRCFEMAPPLVFEAGPASARGRPCLVVENHHTWWSFCRWNERVGAYSAVVFGAGTGFGRDAVAFLAERCAEWGTQDAEYFGDLDREGLQIPWRAANQFAAGLPIRIVPALRWYRRLLARAGDVALPVGAAIEAGAAINWLGQLAGLAGSWLDRGVRVPQELVGTEELGGEGWA